MQKIDKLISFEINSDFGMFKKPDVNTPIYFTYNIIPKPTILGILGAIIGLGGYTQVKNDLGFPEFYEKLKYLPISVVPLTSKGVFQKKIIKYNNTVGYANKDGGTLNISEQTLINPKYKIYLALNLSNKEHSFLYDYIMSKPIRYEYIPYMGKNEFKLDISDSKEEKFTYDFDDIFSINSLFTNNDKFPIKLNEAERDPFDMTMSEVYFYYYERLPNEFDELNQYMYEDFCFTNAKFDKNSEFLKKLNLIRTSENVICLY